jgi:hypothetical protein
MDRWLKTLAPLQIWRAAAGDAGRCTIALAYRVYLKPETIQLLLDLRPGWAPQNGRRARLPQLAGFVGNDFLRYPQPPENRSAAGH